MKISWFEGSNTDYTNQLVRHIREGQAIVLLGAGISSLGPSCLPLGRELRDFVIREAFRDSPLIDQTERLVNARQFQDMVPEVVFSDLYTTFRKKLFGGFEVLRQAVPNVLHQILAYCTNNHNLPLFTTNFDTLLQQAGANSKLVFHLHGSLEEPETMAILLRQVQKNARPHGEKQFLDRSQSKHLYVFGYSGTDHDIMSLISSASFASINWLLRSGAGSYSYENVVRLNLPVIVFKGDLESIGTQLSACFTDFKPQNTEHSGRSLSHTPLSGSLNQGQQYAALGLLLSRIHRFPESLKVLREGLEHRVANNAEEHLRLLIFNAEISLIIGVPKEKVLQELENAMEPAVDSIIYAQLLNAIGLSYLKENFFTVARKFFKQALDLSIRWTRHRDIDDRVLARIVLSQTTNNIGLCYYNEGKLNLSRIHFQKSLRLKRKIGNILGEAASMSNLALVAIRLNRKRSFQYWEGETFRIIEKYGLWRRMINHLRDTAEIFAEKKQFTEADSRLTKAITICNNNASGMMSEKKALLAERQKLTSLM